jgi:DNA polymerase-1
MGQVYEDMAQGGLLEVAHPLLQIHDELLFECREDIADDLAALVQDRFEHCVELDVPLKAGAAKARTWGQLPK